ncbi:hypothetical protein BASA81_010177 [Batrachochytrium salamandrivorans]|nr:hypothetical protein BASA81_010177 [Batrachochytrium salamandrivorans]
MTYCGSSRTGQSTPNNLGMDGLMMQERSHDCFYCGVTNCWQTTPLDSNSKICIDALGRTVQWLCPACGSVNSYDPSGDIVGPEGVTGSSANTNNAPFLSRIQQNSMLRRAYPSKPVFCDMCIQNQQLVADILRDYDPLENEDWEESYLSYKASLESRYPIVCNICAPHVRSCIESTTKNVPSEPTAFVQDQSCDANTPSMNRGSFPRLNLIIGLVATSAFIFFLYRIIACEDDLSFIFSAVPYVYIKSLIITVFVWTVAALQLPQNTRSAILLHAQELRGSSIPSIVGFLVEHTPTSETYLARILLVELFGTNFAHFVAHPVQETHKLRGSFQSYTELELVRLVCTGLPLHRLDFVRQYTLHQVQSGNDVAEVLLLVEDTSLIGEDDHFRLSLVLELKQACAECKDQLELVRFAHSLFPRKQELQREMDVLERRAIFQDFGLKFPFKTTGMEEEDNDGLLLRIFYEQCAGGGGKETQRRGMLPAALVLMRGNVDLWKKRLQRCVVDWLQASLVEFDVVEVIVCALQHMQREAGVDPDQFLTGIAFMATARIKKIAIVRALRALGKFRALVFKEEDLLWMKEKELEMAECGIWKQKIEQVVQTANKPSSVLGLLREIPQTGVSPEKEVRGLRFVSGLIVDFSLYEDGLLETCLGRLVEASPSSGLQVMLDIPAQHLGAVKDLAIWLVAGKKPPGR